MPDSTAAPLPLTETTAGILLAGGQSRRMGADKALIPLCGTPLIARAIAALRPQCDALLISGNGDPARFAAFGLPVVADDLPGFAGPLAGILAGLDFIASYLPEMRFAVSVASDAPFLPNDLVRRLLQVRAEAGAVLACARSAGQTHFATALWPVAIRAELRHALVEEDLHKIERFQERYRCAYAEWPVEPFDPFFNINEPADLARAAELLEANAGHSLAR